MTMKALGDKSISRSQILVIAIAFGALQFVLAGSAQAQFPWWFNRGNSYSYRVKTHSPGQLVSLSPGSTMGTTALGLSPFAGQTLSLSPGYTGQTMSLNPNTLSLSPQSMYYVTNGTTPATALSLSPQSTVQPGVGATTALTLNLSPQATGAQSLSLNGATASLDDGKKFVSLALGSDPTKIGGFMQGLTQKAKALIGAVGTNGVNKQDLANLLLAAGKDALSSTPWGALAEPLLDAFLTPVVNDVIAGVMPSGSGTVAPATNTPAPATNIPAPAANTPAPATSTQTVAAPSGSITFPITGTITVTPTSSGGSVATLVPSTSSVAAPTAATNTVTTPGTLKTDPGAAAAPAVGGP